jgi:hypothetical protein
MEFAEAFSRRDDIFHARVKSAHVQSATLHRLRARSGSASHVQRIRQVQHRLQLAYESPNHLGARGVQH